MGESGAGRYSAGRHVVTVAVMVAALALLAGACGGDSDSGGSPSAPSPTFSPTLLAGSSQVPPLADMLADKRIGPAGAPNVVIEYSSFACSHCADFHTQSLPALKSGYLDRGIATFVHREFSLDRTSVLGAMVARCAGDDRYFAVLDVIYQSQGSWSRGSDSWSAMQKVLRDAGLSQALIDACVATPGLEQGLAAIRQQGIEAYGVSATPTFIVNGTKIVGNVPLPAITSYFR